MIRTGLYKGVQMRGINYMPMHRIHGINGVKCGMRGYTDLKSDKEIKKRVNDTELLELIRGKPIDGADDIMNSVRTLPRYDLIKSDGVIRKEIVEEREGKEGKSYDGMILQYRKAKNIFQFFKEGLMNVWRVNRALRNRENGLFGGKRYIVDYSKGHSKDGKYVIKRSDYGKIIDELSERVQLIKIEYDNGKRDKLVKKDDEMFLTRKEYIEMVRDHEDFPKLPLFGLLFLLIEELSLVFIYVFPSMLPGTCVLPGVLGRRYYSMSMRGFERLMELKGDEGVCRGIIRDVAMNKSSAYSLDDRIRQAVCDSLLCRGTTAAVLHQRQKELLVDDYLILLSGGIRGMSGEEVVHGCVSRGIVSPGGSHDRATVACLRQQLENWLVVRFL